MKLVAKLPLILLVITLTGCQTFHLVESNQPTTLGNLEITPGQQWSQYNSSNKSIRILTRDGILLNVISVTNIKDGEHIYKSKITEANKGFSYQKSMSLEEAAELYIDGLDASDVYNLEMIDEYETTVSGLDAMKLEYRYDTDSGLTYHHQVLVLKNEDELEILNCYAPEEHYYPNLESEFGNIIASAKLKR